MRPRRARIPLGLVLVSASGCAQVGWWGWGAEELGACPAEGEGCFSLVEPLRFPPVIVAPGRIAVVTDDGLRGRSRSLKPTKPARSVGIRRSSPFVIEEITHAGHELVAEGECPASSRTL